IYDAGYDIVNDLDGVIEHFDEVVGLDKLHAIHINDSKNPFKSGGPANMIIKQTILLFVFFSLLRRMIL
ncbi:hypothetical protein PT110_09490, partial [Erysipelothrix rhusiopathiae]|nr:hypothetical protein [Erysipelothrix rhusiopathiae]